MNGNLTEADSILRTKGDINQRRKELDALNAANYEVRSNLEKSEALAKAQAEELATDYFHHFEICKLSLDFDSAAYYIKERASLYNSTNIYFLSDVGVFLHEYVCDYDQAQKYLEKALEQSKSQFGENSIETTKIFNNLAVVMIYQGKYDEALELCSKALNILSNFGENHTEVATSYNNIASIYNKQGKYDEALEIHFKALNIRLSILGENHTDVATSYNNIASIYDTQGKYDGALELYNKALNIYQSILGENHISVAESYIYISNALIFIGNFTDSLEYLNNALKILMLNPQENKKRIDYIRKIITMLEQQLNSNDSN